MAFECLVKGYKKGFDIMVGVKDSFFGLTAPSALGAVYLSIRGVRQFITKMENETPSGIDAY